MRKRILELLDLLERAGSQEIEGAPSIELDTLNEQANWGIQLQIDVLRYALGYSETNTESFIVDARESAAFEDLLDKLGALNGR